MWPYWLVFLIPAGAAFLQPVEPWVLRPTPALRSLAIRWVFVSALLAMFVGWRYQVGGDWTPYLEHWSEVGYLTLDEILERGDPGYWWVTWMVHELDGSVYIANLIFGALFSFGLILFCQNQPRPWLAVTIAVPYMVIVLGMGYTRQGVALGFAMIGLVALSRNKVRIFVLWVAAGALFHKSAVVLVPLAMLAIPRSRIWTGFWVLIATFILYWALLRSSVDELLVNYVEAEYASQGALIRVLMNVVPAAILLKYRTRITNPAERSLWVKISILAFLCVGWLALSPSSTAVDRLALYLIPLQLYVFTRVPDLLARTVRDRRTYVVAVIFYYACVQFVWLVFGEHAQYWLPYRFYPLEDVL